MENGRALYLRCTGRGRPTVILESGIHDSSDLWNLTQTKPPVLSSPSVFAGVGKFTHVCMYDRPGTIRYTTPPALTTRSTPVPMPRSLPGMVSDLHTLLKNADISGPYLLVAHSFGGLILQSFAETYPSESAGLVLIDAFGTELKPLMGVRAWPPYEVFLNQPGTPLDSQPGFETIDIDGAIADVLRTPELPKFPLAVMTKSEPFATSPRVPKEILEKLEEAWPKAQAALVKLELQTPQISATGSDHYVQVHDPDLTISTIKLVFERTRSHSDGDADRAAARN